MGLITKHFMLILRDASTSHIRVLHVASDAKVVFGSHELTRGGIVRVPSAESTAIATGTDLVQPEAGGSLGRRHIAGRRLWGAVSDADIDPA
jgi:hypothetical protein